VTGEIAGASPRVGGAFNLVDHHGRAVGNATYLGRHALIFFGFTHCRVVCPRALGKLCRVLDDLGSLAERVQPLYVTVDPERDTPQVMRAFLEPSYPRFTGLTGSRERIDEAKAAFRVFARRVADPESAGGYAVPHTAIAYLLDESGAYVAHFHDALTENEIAERLRGFLG
jgi:protein SCO1/2